LIVAVGGLSLTSST